MNQGGEMFFRDVANEKKTCLAYLINVAFEVKFMVHLHS